MTTVEAVEIGFNSFEGPDESAKAMFSDFLLTPSQLSCGNWQKPALDTHRN
jgi:hypothetical protein